METDNFDPKKALLTTKIIYFALILGVVFYLGIAFYVSAEKPSFKPDFSDPLLLMLALLSVGAIPAGYMVSKKMLSAINPSDSLIRKFPVYQTSLIIRMAVCEGVALFAGVTILLTANSFGVIFFGIALLVMIGYYPAPDKIGKDIKLSPSEIDKLK